MWREEHIKHCLRLIRAEVEPASFEAFQHYVIDEWPVEKICEACEIKPNQLYQIKWRVMRTLRERMRNLTG